MGYKYEDEELEFEYKGQVYKFRAPSAVEQKAVSKKFKEYDIEKAEPDSDPIDLYINFFVELGLPLDVVSKMSSKGLFGLFEYAIGTKKN